MKTSRVTNDGRKKPVSFQKYISLRLSAAVILIGLALFALLARVYFIQKNNSEDYNKIVLSQRQSEYVSKTIPYRRGDIYDRNGNKLASSEKVYLLILDPAQMKQAEGSSTGSATAKRNVITPTVQAIADCFGMDSSEIRKIIDNNPNSAYVRLIKDVSYDKKQEFLDYQKKKNAEYAASADENEKKNLIKGIWFEDNYKRSYPYGSLGSKVIGFAAADGSGGTGGVEQYYNDQLTGVNGREYGYLDDDANLEKVIRSAQNGNTLVLTIDANIQNIVEKYLNEWQKGEIGSKNAACIVMNPNTGEVLAMADTNSFDLNSPASTGNFTTEEMYDLGLSMCVSDYKKNHPDSPAITKTEVPSHYTEDEIMTFGKQAAMYQVWRNTCVSDTYEPGSPQKVFTVAGALEEGYIKMTDSFKCEGNVTLSDGTNKWRINCVNRNGHGLLDVTGGITNSCNVVMMNIAFIEKSENFMHYQRLFGFGEQTGIDLPAEAKGLGFENDNIGRTTLATNSFGQNYNCTMIQMVSAYCSLINGGYYYQPHVVKQVLSADGTLIDDVQPLLVRETVSQSTCSALKQALYETVTTGTGKAAAVSGYSVGGKTGTAQKLPRSAGKYLVSFCGFAPVENPQLVCYVIVDEPNRPGQEAAHSTFASQIFSKIMGEALPVMGVYPDTSADNYKAPEVKLPAQEGDSRQTLGSAQTPAETPAPTVVPTDEAGMTLMAPTSEGMQINARPAESDEYIAEGDDGDLPDVLSRLFPDTDDTVTAGE